MIMVADTQLVGSGSRKQRPAPGTKSTASAAPVGSALHPLRCLREHGAPVLARGRPPSMFTAHRGWPH
jgi:hypothetical protein